MKVGIVGYTIRLEDPHSSGETYHVPPFNYGSNVLVGDTMGESSVDITYNYSKHFDKSQIIDKTATEAEPYLRSLLETLGNDVVPDYWSATEGNVKQFVSLLFLWGVMHPEGVWRYEP